LFHVQSVSHRLEREGKSTSIFGQTDSDDEKNEDDLCVTKKEGEHFGLVFETSLIFELSFQ